jgi:hypothetical protein
MNIHIQKVAHDFLLQFHTHAYTIGSKLYGISNADSDSDKLCFFTPPASWQHHLGYVSLPNTHQFQYKCKATNTDYIWTTPIQFWKNQQSGESTINTDLIIFNENFRADFNIHNPLHYVYTYKVIKSYLGFAKRDLKQNKEGIHKIIHAERCLYMAEYILLEKNTPKLNELEFFLKHIITTIAEKDANSLKAQIISLETKEKILRLQLQELLQKNLIKNYITAELLPIGNIKYDTQVEHELLITLINSNNLKEFRYE